MLKRWALVVTLGSLVLAASAHAQAVGLSGRLAGETGGPSIGGPSTSIAPVGSEAATDPGIRAALKFADDGDSWAAIKALGKIRRAGVHDVEASFYLAWIYEQMYERERRAVHAETYNRRTLSFLDLTAKSGDGPNDALWAARAKSWKEDRDAHSPLARRLRLANHEVANGDTGPAVVEIQRRVGAKSDGVFGDGTEAVLREWQRDNELEPTGRVDLPTLVKHEEYSRLGVHWSSGSAWRNGRRLGPVEVVTIDRRDVELQTALAYRRMAEAALADGIRLKVVSGFRTYAKQEALRQRDLDGTGNSAAPPGYSNHQDGHALDLNATPAVLKWLNTHGATFGFIRTVPSENWHWEYRPEKTAGAGD